MPYQLRYSVNVDYVGAGTGPVTPQLSQTVQLGSSASFPAIAVPGGDDATQNDFDTALAAMAAQIETQVADNLPQIQGFATGGN